MEAYYLLPGTLAALLHAIPFHSQSPRKFVTDGDVEHCTDEETGPKRVTFPRSQLAELGFESQSVSLGASPNKGIF